MVREAATVRALVSLTGQFSSIDEDLTGHENLVLVGRLLGLGWKAARARATDLLDAFDLSDAGGRQVRTYSGGMRRRLDIASSLVVTSSLKPILRNPPVASTRSDRLNGYVIRPLYD